MKLLVKVVEGEYSDTPQIAILDVTVEFLTTLRQLLSKAPVDLGIKSAFGEYFFVGRKDLPRLMDAAAGRIADWDEFTHLVQENVFWSDNWRKVEVYDRCLIFDQSGVYFKATGAGGRNYLTVPLTRSDIASCEPEDVHAIGAVANA
jgi:hypothetical protein